MTQMMALVLVLFLSSSSLAKYVPVSQSMCWPEAQAYCREHYTDLAVISNAQDNEELRELASQLGNYYWFGMSRSNTADGVWRWSGGGMVSTFFWGPLQPDGGDQIYGLIFHGNWHDANAVWTVPFVCFRVILVEERKTWLEALDHCRLHHSDLVSVSSETELLLMQREMEKNGVSEDVWIGLYFFPEGWLWVDGRPLDYEAWLHDDRPVCPQYGTECTALNTTGDGLRARAVDCEERFYFLCY